MMPLKQLTTLLLLRSISPAPCFQNERQNAANNGGNESSDSTVLLQSKVVFDSWYQGNVQCNSVWLYRRLRVTPLD